MNSNCLKYKEPSGLPSCVQACPAGIDIPRYVRLISEGKFTQALVVIRQKIPFPSVCGYVCPHPCEDACQIKKKLDKPTAIKALKRFAAEHGKNHIEDTVAPPTGKRVAIIGSGPAGLTAAYYLAKFGHKVSIYESLSKAGGTMRTGIPRFILPENILDCEIEAILNLGVELKLNKPVEKIDDLLKARYDAIFISTGLQVGKKLPLPGANLEGVFIGLSLLRDLNLDSKVKLGKKVVVLGGGGVAVDVARTARRLGVTDVHIACLESRANMPAKPWEIKEVEAEGILIHPSRAFIRILGDGGHVTGVECVNLRWMKFDEEGGLHFQAIEGSDHILPADTVIFATGQEFDPSLVSETSGVKITRRRTIVVDPETLATGHRGVFAGGDVVIGPTSVIEAIATGRKAAVSIDKYLGGKGKLDEKLPPGEIIPSSLQGFPVGDRHDGSLLPVEDRLKGFSLVDTGFSNEEEAINEAKRCLKCDVAIAIDASKCVGCLTCCLSCSFTDQGIFNPMKAFVKIANPFEEANTISFTDDCDNCGICARYCPYGALSR